MTASFLRIGTRGSPLALGQARAVRAALAGAHGVSEEEIEIVAIRTSGDHVRDRPLAELGGKGLFTKEIEEALLERRVDLAVHSAKDVPTFLPDGLVLAGCLERADPRDVLVSPEFKTLDALPQGAVVGTASVRRSALLKRLRPDVKTELLRGNVETRLKRVEAGEFDATLLALAGLTRLGLEKHATEILDVKRFLPACGQGTIAIETRNNDAGTARAIAAVNHRPTSLALVAERAMLAVLDGSCRTPISGHAGFDGDRLALDGLVIEPEGREVWTVATSGAAADADRIGREAGEDLLSRVPKHVLADGAP